MDDRAVPAILFGCCVGGAVASRLAMARRAAVAARGGGGAARAVGGQERGCGWPVRSIASTGWRAMAILDAHAGRLGTRFAIGLVARTTAHVLGRDRPLRPRSSWLQYAAPVPALVGAAAGSLVRSRDLLLCGPSMASRHLRSTTPDTNVGQRAAATLAKIQRYAPPLVFATGELDTTTRELYPAVVDYIIASTRR